MAAANKTPAAGCAKPHPATLIRLSITELSSLVFQHGAGGLLHASDVVPIRHDELDVATRTGGSDLDKQVATALHKLTLTNICSYIEICHHDNSQISLLIYCSHSR